MRECRRRGCKVHGGGTNCYHLRNKRLQTFEDIIQDYIARGRAMAKHELAYYAAAPSLSEAIRLAALAIRDGEKRQDHQRRIPSSALARLYRKLSCEEAAIKGAYNFKDLHTVVQRVGRDEKYIGELTIYDTALRIGAKLAKTPEDVYLHAGTRKGAKMLGLNVKAECLPLDAFPKEFHRLEPHEIEDVLCIYKDDLVRLRSKQP